MRTLISDKLLETLSPSLKNRVTMSESGNPGFNENPMYPSVMVILI